MTDMLLSLLVFNYIQVFIESPDVRRSAGHCSEQPQRSQAAARILRSQVVTMKDKTVKLRKQRN